MEFKLDIYLYSILFVGLLVANHVLKWALPEWLLWLAAAPLIFGIVVAVAVAIIAALGVGAAASRGRFR